MYSFSKTIYHKPRNLDDVNRKVLGKVRKNDLQLELKNDMLPTDSF